MLLQITKMRCWRIMTVNQPAELDHKTVSPAVLNSSSSSDNLLGGGSSSIGHSSKLELSFEYLMNDQQLQWITIVSQQVSEKSHNNYFT